MVVGQAVGGPITSSRPGIAAAAAIGLVAAALGGCERPGLAEADGRPSSPRPLREALPGHQFRMKMNGPTEYFNSSGLYASKRDLFLRGRYRVNGDWVCVFYENIRDSSRYCRRIVVLADGSFSITHVEVDGSVEAIDPPTIVYPEIIGVEQ